MTEQSNEQRLQQAHEAGDTALLSALYGKNAETHEANGDIDAACFYLTQAYIFALDAGLPTAAEYNKRLTAYGRDELVHDLKSQ